jgi:hypothetical protein
MFGRPAGAKPPEERILKMEMKPVESRETTEESESAEQTAARRLDDATFEPQALVEQTGEYRQAESIQADFVALVDTAVRQAAAESGPAPVSEQRPSAAIHAASGGISAESAVNESDSRNDGPAQNSPATAISPKPGSAAGSEGEPVEEEIGPKPKKYYKEVGGWDAFGVHIPGTMTEFTNEYADLQKPGSAAGDRPGSDPIGEYDVGPKTIKENPLPKPGNTIADGPGNEPVDEEIGPKPKKYYKEVGGWDAFGVHIPGTMTEFTNEYADLQKPGSAAGSEGEPVDEEIGPKPKKYYKEVGGWDAFGVHIPGTMTEFTNEYADLQKPGSAAGDGPGSDPIGEYDVGPKTIKENPLPKPGNTIADGPGNEPVGEEIGPKPKKYYKEVGGWDAFGVHIPGTMTEFTNEYADLQKPGSTAGDDPGSEPVDEEIGPKPKKYYKEVGGWDAFGVHIPGTMTEFTNEYADLQKPGSTAGTGAGNLSVEKQIGEHKNEPADPKKTGNTVSNNPESGLVDEQIGPKEQPKKKQPYSYTKKDPEQSVLGVTWGGEEHTYYNTFADIENPAKQSTQGQTGKPVDGKPEKGQEEDESD